MVVENVRGDLLGCVASTRVARWNKVVFLVNQGLLGTPVHLRAKS